MGFSTHFNWQKIVLGITELPESSGTWQHIAWKSVGRIDHTDLTATLQINFSTLAIRLPSTNVSFDDKAKVPFALTIG